MNITDIFYMSGTHWDREWYQDFQSFRYRLVKMTDELLGYLENEPDYGVFHFDGQTVVLEDYCDIAPENEARLKALIQKGKIKIGPWYCMPDEFIISGESIIRNLTVGGKLCKMWGAEAWKVGYICDIFGHIAQMPQLFNGFGIEFAILGRGTTEEDPRYINWNSPDGSSCVAFLLEPDGGYGNIRRIISKAENADELKRALKADIDEKAERANSSVVILTDGSDHNTVCRDTPECLRVLRELYPNAKVHHGDLETAAQLLKESAREYTVKMGELNKTAIYPHTYLHQVAHTLSSYYPLKKANDECQTLLEKRLEPMLAYSALTGYHFRRGFLDLAYKYLLQNHPHDSICGCSIAQVHKDMRYRFDQIKEIGGALEEEFLYKNRPQKGVSSSYALRLYNPLPFARVETVTADVLLKKDFPYRYSEPFGYERISSFLLVDADGAEIPYGISGVTRDYHERVYENVNEGGERYDITFEAKLPAGGYCEYKLIPHPKPVRYFARLRSGSYFVENEHIRLDISGTGELTIFDKKTGVAYPGLCGLMDDGEIGDGWYHVNPINDRTVYSYGVAARVEKLEDSPSRCAFRITKLMEVPAGIEDSATGKRRSDSYVKLPVTIDVGLSKHARYADVSLNVSNTALDHRLRLLLPTGISDTTYFSGQAFYCNERPTGIDCNTQQWREHDHYQKETNGIVGKRGKNGDGIALVIADGVHECAAFEGENLSVTLFRAFCTTVSTMGEPEGQLLQDLSYRFALVPLDRTVTYSDLVRLKDCLCVSPIAVSSEVKTEYAPENRSFMELEGDNLILSIAKSPEDGDENALIARIFNASAAPATGSLRFFKSVKTAQLTNLNEQPHKAVSVEDGVLPVSLSGWKIQTYRVTF